MKLFGRLDTEVFRNSEISRETMSCFLFIQDNKKDMQISFEDMQEFERFKSKVIAHSVLGEFTMRVHRVHRVHQVAQKYFQSMLISSRSMTPTGSASATARRKSAIPKLNFTSSPNDLPFDESKHYIKEVCVWFHFHFNHFKINHELDSLDLRCFQAYIRSSPRGPVPAAAVPRHDRPPLPPSRSVMTVR